MPVLLTRDARLRIVTAMCVTLQRYGMRVTFTSLLDETGICQRDHRAAQYLRTKISVCMESYFVPQVVQIKFPSFLGKIVGCTRCYWIDQTLNEQVKDLFVTEKIDFVSIEFGI